MSSDRVESISGDFAYKPTGSRQLIVQTQRLELGAYSPVIVARLWVTARQLGLAVSLPRHVTFLYLPSTRPPRDM